MKNTVLVFIALIGFYTLARNNVRALPDQILWISHPDIFYKVFLPLLMLTSAFVSLIKRDKINLFYLSFCAMVIDAIDRLSIFINNYYMYFTFDPPPRVNHSIDAITGRINYLPSYIMLLMEILLIVFVFRYIVRSKYKKVTTDS